MSESLLDLSGKIDPLLVEIFDATLRRFANECGNAVTNNHFETLSGMRTGFK